MGALVLRYTEYVPSFIAPATSCLVSPPTPIHPILSYYLLHSSGFIHCIHPWIITIAACSYSTGRSPNRREREEQSRSIEVDRSGHQGPREAKGSRIGEPDETPKEEDRRTMLGGRPLFVLFGSSIVQYSFSNGGWGAALADIYARKVRYACCCIKSVRLCFSHLLQAPAPPPRRRRWWR